MMLSMTKEKEKQIYLPTHLILSVMKMSRQIREDSKNSHNATTGVIRLNFFFRVCLCQLDWEMSGVFLLSRTKTVNFSN